MTTIKSRSIQDTYSFLYSWGLGLYKMNGSVLSYSCSNVISTWQQSSYKHLLKTQKMDSIKDNKHLVFSVIEHKVRQYDKMKMFNFNVLHFNTVDSFSCAPVLLYFWNSDPSFEIVFRLNTKQRLQMTNAWVEEMIYSKVLRNWGQVVFSQIVNVLYRFEWKQCIELKTQHCECTVTWMRKIHTNWTSW